MIDHERIKPGHKVKLSDGTEGIVKGCYLSPNGIVIRVLPGGGGIVQRNVPIQDVTEVSDAVHKRTPEEIHGTGTATPEVGETD